MLLVETLHERVERLFGDGRVERHHHLRSRSVSDERMLVSREAVVSSRIKQHSRQPGSPTERIQRIRQRPEVRHLARLEERQLVAVLIDNRVAEQVAPERFLRHLIHHITRDDHHPLRVQPDQLIVAGDPLTHPISVPVQIHIEQHFGEQVAGLTARERPLQNRQRRVAKQSTRATVHKRLKLEPGLREHQQARMDRSRHNRIPCALQRCELRKRHRRSDIPLTVERKLLQQLQIVIPAHP